jgi:hypothetical protein
VIFTGFLYRRRQSILGLYGELRIVRVWRFAARKIWVLLEGCMAVKQTKGNVTVEACVFSAPGFDLP